MAERFENPRAYADKRETIRVRHNYTDEELAELREKHTDMAIQLATLDQEKKDFNEDWKSRSNPVKKDAKNTLKKVRDRFEDVEMEVNVIADEPAQKMLFVTDDGEQVGSRPMTQDERKQFRLIVPEKKSA